MAQEVRLRSGTLGRPRPPRGEHGARFRHGASFVRDAVALMVRDGKLLRRAMIPAFVFVGMLAVMASTEVAAGESSRTWWGAFYLAVIGSAQVSPIVFTRSYARLAAHARVSAGFDPQPPYLRSYLEATWEAILQVAGLALYLAPLAFLSRIVPGFTYVAAFIGFLWASHWAAVEALDAARSAPEQEPEERGKVVIRRPWFARPPAKGNPLYPLRAFLAPLASWGIPFGRSFRRWHGELYFMETRPPTAAGFTFAVALILLVPVLNLFARPITVMAAALWIAHEQHADELEAQPETATATAG